MSRFFSVAFILFCFEIGIFLIVVPWSSLWENNIVFNYLPSLRGVMLHSIVRGTVSGLGLIDFLLGVTEVTRLRHSIRAGAGTRDNPLP